MGVDMEEAMAWWAWKRGRGNFACPQRSSSAFCASKKIELTIRLFPILSLMLRFLGVI